MYIIAWRYNVVGAAKEEFLRAYGADGTWAALFRASPHYRGTRLFEDCDTPGSFITFDIWSDEAYRTRFLEEHRTAYEQLDAACAHLAIRDERIGEILPAVWNA